MPLKDNLPPFAATMPDMEELLAAEQPELDRIETDRAAMHIEFCAQTISALTINDWEDMLGFDHPAAWPIARRRERVQSRLLAAAPITPTMLKETIERVGGVSCTLVEDADKLTCTVSFTGQYGVPLYIDDIKKEVEQIRPYHIIVSYEYLYALLQEYSGYTLFGLAAYTLGSSRMARR